MRYSRRLFRENASYRGATVAKVKRDMSRKLKKAGFSFLRTMMAFATAGDEMEQWSKRGKRITIAFRGQSGDPSHIEAIIVRPEYGEPKHFDAFGQEDAAIDSAIEYLESGLNESRRFRGRRLNERKSYSVFADGGLGGRDEYRDFDSEEEAGRFADSLDKRKFKGYRISDPEGDVIASHTYLHGKREIFTYFLCNIDEETGDHETYYESNPFYDFDECCDAAKEAVKKETEPVISFVFAGEYEKDNGDIYGDTTAVLAISNTRSVNADEYV